MSPNSTFDTDAMNNYLNTVAEMRRLTEAGATHGELLQSVEVRVLVQNFYQVADHIQLGNVFVHHDYRLF